MTPMTDTARITLIPIGGTFAFACRQWARFLVKISLNAKPLPCLNKNRTISPCDLTQAQSL